MVIVGAGITGLTAACALASYGVPAVLLDEDNTVGVKGASSRGICYTQKSLEIFHRLGRLRAHRAPRASSGAWAAPSPATDEVYSFDLRQQSGYNLSIQPPFINIQQFYIEGYLVERIHELGHVDLRWNNRVTGFGQDDGDATLTVDTPAGDYRIRARARDRRHRLATAPSGWVGATVHGQEGDDRWCIADVRFTKHPPVERHTWIEAPFNENRAVWQHLMGDEVWRIDYQMAPNADPEEVSREDVVRERLQRQFGADVRGRDRLGRALRLPQRVRRRDAPSAACSSWATRPRWSAPSARAAATPASPTPTTWPGSWPPCSRAGPPATLLDSYHEERHEAAPQNVQVTNRTARFLRPADGIERMFRTAAMGLARQYPFARQLVNTGRMAVANPYTRSSVCDRTGGLSVQNVAFDWPDGTTGVVNDLLQWADGRSAAAGVRRPAGRAGLSRLRELSQAAPLRCVQVLGPGQPAGRRRTRARPARAPAGRLPCLWPCLGAGAARQLRRRHRRERGRRPGAGHRPGTGPAEVEA